MVEYAAASDTMSDDAHRNNARRDGRPADDATATESPVVIIVVTAMKCATVLAVARMLVGGAAGFSQR